MLTDEFVKDPENKNDLINFYKKKKIS